MKIFQGKELKINRLNFRPLDKSAYLNIIFLISQPKHMLCIKKNCLNEHPKHMFKLMAKEINAILGALES